MGRRILPSTCPTPHKPSLTLSPTLSLPPFFVSPQMMDVVRALSDRHRVSEGDAMAVRHALRAASYALAVLCGYVTSAPEIYTSYVYMCI